MFELQQIKEVGGEDFIIYNGHDEVLAGGLLMGADGAIGSTFNMMPKAFIELYHRAQQGEWDKVMNVQTVINRVIHQLLNYDVIAFEKYICFLQGLIQTPKTRMPLQQLAEEDAERIHSIYRQTELLHRIHDNSLHK